MRPYLKHHSRHQSRFVSQSSEDIAWLAGLLEGEGCFSLSVVARKYAYPAIYLGMADRDVVERAAKLMGSEDRVHQKYKTTPPNQKTQWVVRAYGATALDVMKAILPYLGERRSMKVKEVIASSAWDEQGPALGKRQPSSEENH